MECSRNRPLDETTKCETVDKQELHFSPNADILLLNSVFGLIC